MAYELSLYVSLQLPSRLKGRVVAQAVSFGPDRFELGILDLGFVVDKMVPTFRFSLVSIIPPVIRTKRCL